jgi:hypothetical protein
MLSRQKLVYRKHILHAMKCHGKCQIDNKKDMNFVAPPMAWMGLGDIFWHAKLVIYLVIYTLVHDKSVFMWSKRIL